MFFGILVAIMLIVGVILTAVKSTHYAGRIILTVCAAIAGVAMMGMVFVMLLIAGTPTWWVILAAVALVGLIAAAQMCLIWGKLKKKKVWMSLLAGVLLCVVTIGGYVGHQAWLDSITMAEPSDFFFRYAPYGEDSEVAVLDEPSDLTLDSNLPRMDGATALFPVYSSFARAVYPESALDTNNIREVLDCRTTTRAYEKIVDGEADIIFVAGPSEAQLEYADEMGVELTFTPIGREAFVFFVNSGNPMEDISYDDIRGIYSGRITRWEEMGVSGLGDIRAFQRDEGSGSQSALQRLMAGEELMTPIEEDVVDGMGGIISRTADYKNYRNAIGFSFRFYSTEMVKNDRIKLLSVNGVAPTLENIENGTYPIASEFFAVTRSDADENTLRLLEWILGEQGQALVEATGYTPIG